MNPRIRNACVLFALGGFAVSTAWSQTADHKMVKASELKWAEVPSLPKGAMAATIEGPMSEAVPFTVRIKVPANYKIPPHWHPAIEHVTVLSGEFQMGIGDKWDAKAMMPVKPGDMMIMQPKTAHYVLAKSATVLQLHGTGPWGTTYVNPDDDPRNAKKK